MKKHERITQRVKADKELLKRINENYYGNYSEPKISDFIKDAETYIKAIKERRMLCIIESVSKSGMSRRMRFHSCERHGENHYYRQYVMLFKCLGYYGYKETDNSFRIDGCGRKGWKVSAKNGILNIDSQMPFGFKFNAKYREVE